MGVVIMILSFVVAKVPGNLYDIIMKVVNLFVAPLFVLFFMALFVPFATERGTFLGGILAVGIAVAIAFWKIGGITVLWIMPVSLVTGVMGAMCFSAIDRSIKRRLRREYAE